jgi:hypothetical protein
MKAVKRLYQIIIVFDLKHSLPLLHLYKCHISGKYKPSFLEMLNRGIMYDQY